MEKLKHLISNIKSRIEDDLISSSIFGFTSNTVATHDPEPLTLKTIEEMKSKILDVPKIPKLVEKPWPLVQVRTHKKKRINKKWLKRYGVIPDTSVDTGDVWIIKPPYDFSFPVPNTILRPLLVAYPNTYRIMKEAIGGIEYA